MAARGPIAAGVVLLIGAAYVAGVWPERERRLTVEAEVISLREQVADAEARVRLGRLLEQMLTLMDAATAQNYGYAQGLSSRFYDDVRAEAARTPVPAFKVLLENVLQSRDIVTAGLARGDETVIESLRETQRQLREALGEAAPKNSASARLRASP
jgi:hypothetical protein